MTQGLQWLEYEMEEPPRAVIEALAVEEPVLRLMLKMVEQAVSDVGKLQKLRAGDLSQRWVRARIADLGQYEPEAFLTEQTMAHDVLGLEASIFRRMFNGEGT